MLDARLTDRQRGLCCPGRVESRMTITRLCEICPTLPRPLTTYYLGVASILSKRKTNIRVLHVCCRGLHQHDHPRRSGQTLSETPSTSPLSIPPLPLGHQPPVQPCNVKIAAHPTNSSWTLPWTCCANWLRPRACPRRGSTTDTLLCLTLHLAG
jgi:hypothetical protein